MLELYHCAIQGALTGISIADARKSDFPLIFVNEGFERITGYLSAEVLGKSWRFLARDDQEQPGLEQVDTALRDGKSCRVVLRSYRKDGSLFWNELALSPVFDGDGQLTHFAGIQTDVTEWKQAEEALKASEEQLRSLIASMDDLVFSITLEGRILVYHDAALSAHDTPITPSRLFVGRRFRDVLPSDLSEPLEQVMKSVAKTLTTQRLEYSLTIERKQRHFSARVSPLIDSNEIKLVGFTVVASDITEAVESRLRQQRLLELEQLHRQVAAVFAESDHPNEAINAVLALAGKYLDISRAYVFHFRENERLVDNSHEWCAPDIQPEMEHLQGLPYDQIVPSLMPMLAEQGIIVSDYIDDLPEDIRDFLAPQGVQGLLAVAFHVDERLQGFIGFDDTRQPRAWLPETIAAIRSIADGYARMLERENARRDLIAARDTALRSSRLKGEFMSNTSHEIRTPLMHVMGMLELLLGTKLDQEQREFVDYAYGGARNLLQIVEDILDFSKLDAGQFELKMEPVDLRAIVTEVKATLMPPAAKKQLLLTAEVAANVPERVLGDPTRLRQVLVNLTSNAVKFTSSGLVHIQVQQLDVIQGSSRLRFSVMDTGMGIAKGELSTIFQSFVQGDGSTTRRHGGIGLGLSICKQLVDLMGGEISVTSQKAQGSTFEFTLMMPVVMEARPRDLDSNLSLLHLMVVDENETARYVLSQQLRMWRSVVTELDNPAYIHSMLKAAGNGSKPIDAVFIRCGRTPSELEGIASTVRAMMGDKWMPHLIRIDDEALPFDAEKSAYDRRLVRPVRPEDLHDLLVTVWQQGRWRDETRSGAV